MTVETTNLPQNSIVAICVSHVEFANNTMLLFHDCENLQQTNYSPGDPARSYSTSLRAHLMDNFFYCVTVEGPISSLGGSRNTFMCTFLYTVDSINKLSNFSGTSHPPKGVITCIFSYNILVI
uniref:Uncharacterized protein n=1 Tax=Rhizophagus irregularis (strain DAOM 181602 / DAOM 197198 / MUCL 43194) TaxID=747089 RepID=U9SUN5_RHIID